MKEKMKLLAETKTYQLVDSTEKQKIFGNRWVFRIKMKSDGSVN